MVMNEVIVGIDLGTTQSAVAVVDSGFPILLADGDGSTLTPSAVWYGQDGALEVGRAALRRSGVEPVVISVKSLMGRRPSEANGRLTRKERSSRKGVRWLRKRFLRRF